MVIALGTTHAQAVGAAGAKIMSNDSSCETTWTKPSDHVLGLSPGFEDQLARRVEHALDCEDTISRFGYPIYCCAHLLSPFLKVFGLTPP
jgi:hypothetical protein